MTEEWRTKHKKIDAVNTLEMNKERERLQKENAKRKGQKSFTYKQPVEIELGDRTKGVDELFELPEKWLWVALDSCVWSVSDGPHFSPNYVEKENGISFISSRNISYDKIDFRDSKYVSETDHKELIRRGKPENDDILVTKGGKTGIAHKVNTDIEFSIWVHVALLKLIKKYVDADYLRDVLTSDFLYRQSQAQTHGVGNQDLGLTRMIFMTIPLPPLEEQKEIAKRVKQLFAYSEKLEARYIKAKTMIDKLPQSILAKTFRGELVAQDPNDEPASVLLERIKKEKEKLAAEKKGKKSKEYSIEESPLKIAAEKKVKYKKVKM
ncbi:MAG: restriction endonuclease subunit S [Saprospiraceae bacterium]|nr:restriction endonuclease subunit S [Saprospiraceae bacterium]